MTARANQRQMQPVPRWNSATTASVSLLMLLTLCACARDPTTEVVTIRPNESLQVDGAEAPRLAPNQGIAPGRYIIRGKVAKDSLWGTGSLSVGVFGKRLEFDPPLCREHFVTLSGDEQGNRRLSFELSFTVRAIQDFEGEEVTIPGENQEERKAYAAKGEGTAHSGHVDLKWFALPRLRQPELGSGSIFDLSVQTLDRREAMAFKLEQRP